MEKLQEKEEITLLLMVNVNVGVQLQTWMLWIMLTKVGLVPLTVSIQVGEPLKVYLVVKKKILKIMEETQEKSEKTVHIEIFDIHDFS